jgi:hypothetical protein
MAGHDLRLCELQPASRGASSRAAFVRHVPGTSWMTSRPSPDRTTNRLVCRDAITATGFDWFRRFLESSGRSGSNEAQVAADATDHIGIMKDHRNRDCRRNDSGGQVIQEHPPDGRAVETRTGTRASREHPAVVRVGVQYKGCLAIAHDETARCIRQAWMGAHRNGFRTSIMRQESACMRKWITSHGMHEDSARGAGAIVGRCALDTIFEMAADRCRLIARKRLPSRWRRRSSGASRPTAATSRRASSSVTFAPSRPAASVSKCPMASRIVARTRGSSRRDTSCHAMTRSAYIRSRLAWPRMTETSHSTTFGTPTDDNGQAVAKVRRWFINGSRSDTALASPHRSGRRRNTTSTE